MIYMTTCFGRNREHQCSSCCSRSSRRHRSSVRTCLCTQRLLDSTLCSLQDDRSGGLEKQENVAKDENLESFKLVLSLSLSPCTLYLSSIVYTYTYLPKGQVATISSQQIPSSAQRASHIKDDGSPVNNSIPRHDPIMQQSL